MRPLGSAVAAAFCAVGVLLLSACASAPVPPAQHGQGSAVVQEAVFEAAGRISLSTPPTPTEKGQSFIAQFRFLGGEQAGQLHLYAPTGSVVAGLYWQPGLAVLRQGDDKRVYDTPEAMMEAALGSSLPLPFLLAALKGQSSAPRDDWQLDLQQYDKGLIQAERLQPLPRVKVRIKLDETPSEKSPVPPSQGGFTR